MDENPRIQRDREFWERAFLAALTGKANGKTRWVKKGQDRVAADAEQIAAHASSIAWAALAAWYAHAPGLRRVDAPAA